MEEEYIDTNQKKENKPLESLPWQTEWWKRKFGRLKGEEGKETGAIISNAAKNVLLLKTIYMFVNYTGVV